MRFLILRCKSQTFLSISLGPNCTSVHASVPLNVLHFDRFGDTSRMTLTSSPRHSVEWRVSCADQTLNLDAFKFASLPPSSLSCLSFCPAPLDVCFYSIRRFGADII